MTGPAELPAIVAVEADAEELERLRRELAGRYARDYRLVCERSPAAAMAKLEQFRADGTPVAVVLADQWMPGLTGEELLARVRALHPAAKRGLLLRFGGWGDRATAAAVHRAMALGHIDYYVLKPWLAPDELFHRTMSEFLHEWRRAEPSQPKEIVIIGEPWTQRSHEVRDLLTRNGMPISFIGSETEAGRQLLASAGADAGTDLPVVFMLGGHVLSNPSTEELARAMGCIVTLGRPDYDLIVVGAGPAGLAAAVYGSSEGLRTLVIEAQAVGGQAGSSSLIRNYLGFSRGVSGADLATRAYQQAWVFGADVLLVREAVGLSRDGERWQVELNDGDRASAPAVVLAGGVSYRRLGIEELEALSGAGVFYGASTAEAHALRGERVFVVGGGNSAGQAAMHLSRYAEQVTLVVRARSLAASMSSYLQTEIEAAPNIDVRYGTRVVGGGGEGRLQHLALDDGSSTTLVDAAGLFILIGARPRTQWLPDEVMRDRWGFVCTGADVSDSPMWPLERPPLPLETSAPGVFAAGDVRRRSVKRVASAVGEGSIAISQVHELRVHEKLAARPR